MKRFTPPVRRRRNGFGAAAARAASPIVVVAAVDMILPVGVGANDACVSGEAFAADEAFIHAGLDRALEHAAQNVSVAEAAVAVLRESGVIRDRIFETQSAKPAVRQIEAHLFTQTPLGADGVAIANQQHPDHQFWINRRPAEVAVMRRELSTQAREIEHRIDLAQQMIGRNLLIEIELVEKLILRS